MASAPPTTSPHDRREGGEWTLLQTVKNQGIYAAVRTLLLALRPLPAAWLVPLGRRLGSGLYVLGIAHKRVALDNLARVYPELTLAERRDLGARVYRRLGGYLGGAVAQLLRPGRFVAVPFEAGSREVLEEALREKRGVLFASAHLGPWEQLAGSLVRHGFPLTTLARESYDPRFMRLYDRLRGGAGVKAIYRGRATAALQIVRTLRRGELLGAPMDLRSRVPSVSAPFLGTPAASPVGPARIALRTRAPVVVGTVVPAGSGEKLVIRVTRIVTGDLIVGATGEVELTRRLNEEVGSRIRAFPEGWVWMHPRWQVGDPASLDGDETTAGGAANGRGPLEDSAPSVGETRYTSAALVDDLR
jgi:KDO2-lipid IV(A) lauroyltransferase